MSPLLLICRRLLCCLACFLCLLPVVAAAQSPPLLRLEQAVTLALAHNQGLQIAADQTRDGEISVRLQQDQFLPQITASGTASLHHDVGAQEEDRNYGNLASDIRLSLNLFSGFSNQATLENARQILAARQHSFGRAQQQVVFTVIGNYLNAVKALEQIRVAEQNLRDNAQQLSDIEAYHQAGRRPVTDVYKQQAETARARSTLLGARRDYRVNKLALLQSIGSDATTKIEVVLPDSPLLQTIPETSETVLLATALTGRPDLLALQKNVAASVEQIRLAQAGHYPSVDLVAVAATSFNDREEDSFASQLKEDNLTGSLSLSTAI
ncbi:MAG: TolC family protein [Desulfuromonadaceae bacterium]|nr:TolC family protein [Desulfuromonadaceae bacterium]